MTRFFGESTCIIDITRFKLFEYLLMSVNKYYLNFNHSENGVRHDTIVKLVDKSIHTQHYRSPLTVGNTGPSTTLPTNQLTAHLHLLEAIVSRVRPVHDRFLGGVIEERALGQRDIGGHARDDDPGTQQRSVYTCTSARQVDRELDRSMMARFDGLFRSERLASDMSAITRVIIILEWQRTLLTATELGGSPRSLL